MRAPRRVTRRSQTGADAGPRDLRRQPMNWITERRSAEDPLVPASARRRRTSGSNARTAARWSSTGTSRPTCASCPAPATTCAWPRTLRLKSLFDDGVCDESADCPKCRVDPLKFRDEQALLDRLKDARAKTGSPMRVRRRTAGSTACRSPSRVQDFDFMGGSLGMAAGEAIIAGCKRAVERQHARSSSSPPPAARACRKACSR